MDEHKGERQCCEYCWRPNDASVDKAAWEHNEGCPLEAGLSAKKRDRRMREWNRGYNDGLDDNYIHWWQYRHYSRTFLYGHRSGLNDLEVSIENAHTHAEY